MTDLTGCRPKHYARTDCELYEVEVGMLVFCATSENVPGARSFVVCRRFGVDPEMATHPPPSLNDPVFQVENYPATCKQHSRGYA